MQGPPGERGKEVSFRLFFYLGTRLSLSQYVDRVFQSFHFSCKSQVFIVFLMLLFLFLVLFCVIFRVQLEEMESMEDRERQGHKAHGEATECQENQDLLAEE